LQRSRSPTRVAQVLTVLQAVLWIFPTGLGAQDTPAVTLRWRLNGPSAVRLGTRGTLVLASTPAVLVEEHVFSLQSRVCPALTLDAECEIDVQVEIDRYGVGPDSGAAQQALHDITSGTRTRAMLSTRGTWESLPRGTSSSCLSGAFGEQMSSALPLSLPLGPVRPGDTWPVHLLSQRSNTLFGLMQAEVIGWATLDSVTSDSAGSRAWISVTADVAERAGRDRSATIPKSEIVWDLDQDGPVQATTERYGRYDAAPNEISSAPTRHQIRGRFLLTRLRPDSVIGVP
jgi:hypothetical protein